MSFALHYLFSALKDACSLHSNRNFTVNLLSLRPSYVHRVSECRSAVDAEMPKSLSRTGKHLVLTLFHTTHKCQLVPWFSELPWPLFKHFTYFSDVYWRWIIFSNVIPAFLLISLLQIMVNHALPFGTWNSVTSERNRLKICSFVSPTFIKTVLKFQPNRLHLRKMANIFHSL